MLLTTKQPAHHTYQSFHDYIPLTPPSTARFSPTLISTGHSLPSVPVIDKSLPPLPAPNHTKPSMATPHRGLPPPAAMPITQTTQQPPPPPIGQQPPLSQPMGQLPAPPQWQGAEESMRNWLHAKAEEDKRKQEEEKTRQESLRLEQRKIEQDMLRTSLSGGIPPYLIPMVFAGMGGGNLPNASLEWAQHYLAQAHQLQQQQIQQQQLTAQGHSSPEQLQRRDSRAQPPTYSSQQASAPLTLSSTPTGAPSSQQSAGFLPGFPVSPSSRSRQIAQTQGAITGPPQIHLPRLNTGEMYIPPPLPGPTMQVLPGQTSYPMQQSQTTAQQESQSSPSIYFHHWHPPTSQADHTSSPKKRKATGPQQAAPPPSSQPQYTSPSFSQAGSSVSNTPSHRKRGHSRQRSDLSSRGMDPYARPPSGHRHSESAYGARAVASPTQATSPEHGQLGAISTEARRHSGGPHTVSSLLEQSESHSHSQSQQPHREPLYPVGPEMRHEEQRRTPERDGLRPAKNSKRDDRRD
ncbi:hypothetical protein B7494_g5446 [Chlorociboria aeruginascens]|nr:hypothetical protein B7494_g5446 [Chlorociboria aeruginascens]